jgi:hypothetical protein
MKCVKKPSFIRRAGPYSPCLLTERPTKGETLEAPGEILHFGFFSQSLEEIRALTFAGFFS